MWPLDGLKLVYTLLFASICAIVTGWALVDRLLPGAEPSTKLGISGLAGFGLFGILELFWGLVMTRDPIPSTAIAALTGLLLGKWLKSIKGSKWTPPIPQGLELAFIAAFSVAILFALIGAAAPSTSLDWDSLAYHLAVPKLWIQQGHISSIWFIHHSNFPQVVDNLYIWGLQWGGQSGAKAFSVAFLVFGLMAIFGLARQEYGKWAGWWAGLGFVSVPLIVWESGTAYIDVAHGLYAGLGIYFAAKLLANPTEKNWFWLSAIFLSLAAGSKYTGLQTIFAACVVLAVGLALKKQIAQGVKLAALLGIVSLALASPWYIRNVIWTGNPVYPFFYSKLDGRGWGQRQADIYTHEQNTFGVGRIPATTEQDVAVNPIDPSRIGHAILGLAYQPGRYINPGQVDGNGTPLGAFGAVLLAGMMAWLISAKGRALEIGVLGASLVTLGMWFVLSEQSRYVIALAPPLAILLGGAIARLKVGPLLAGLTALQAAYCLWLVETTVVAMELPVVMGSVTPEQYQRKYISFYDGSQIINKLGPSSKTALYDEVFGFLLDVPYVWANPGHSTLIPYDSMRNATDYAAAMKHLGFTHVYVNVQPAGVTQEAAVRWLQAAGLSQPDKPFAGTEREALFNSFEQKYKLLLAEGARERLLKPVAGNGRWMLFEIK